MTIFPFSGMKNTSDVNVKHIHVTCAIIERNGLVLADKATLFLKIQLSRFSLSSWGIFCLCTSRCAQGSFFVIFQQQVKQCHADV